MTDATQIFTDGSSHQNKGGWAFVIPDMNYNGQGRETEEVTNQRMEITAVIKALEHVQGDIENVVILSDSLYVVNVGLKLWKPTKNTDLWQKVYELLSKFKQVDFKWVKAHNGNKYNEMADQLARYNTDIIKE